MLGITSFTLFLVAVFLLNVTPGPDTAYIVGRSVAQGRGAGIVSALGISAGCIVHTLACAFGLTALLAASATAFTVVKFAGAIYLIYLGVRLIFAEAGRQSRHGRRAENQNCTQVAAPALRARIRHERAEPEGRIVLRVVFPAVRRRRQSTQGARVPRARPRLHSDEHRLEQFCRVDRGQRDATLFRQAGREALAGPGCRRRIRRTWNKARDFTQVIELSDDAPI